MFIILVIVTLTDRFAAIRMLNLKVGKKAWLDSGRIKEMAHLEQLLGSCLVGGSHL